MSDTKEILLSKIRDGEVMTGAEKMRLVALLSVPAILGQLSTIIMQYIDAQMVGSLGAEASASIYLVSTTTWLFGGLCHSIGTGFCVLAAHHIGAKEDDQARDILRQALLLCLGFSLIVSVLCCSISYHLPMWLGGSEEIAPLSTTYFLIWSLTLPVMQMLYLSSGMLRSSGEMRIPALLGGVMCLLDILFNSIFIPRWGVAGAALATSISGLVVAVCALWYMLTRAQHLSLVGQPRHLRIQWDTVRRAMRISIPMAIEHVVFCGAQIVTTLIVAPLGKVAIAANGFGVTVESLCYMPGYGIGDAAITLIGQSLGAKRRDLARGFSWLTVLLGMVVMGVLGVVMYLTAPYVMHIMTPDEGVRLAGVEALRIEAYAEPMYAASIVAYGVFVGSGETTIPCIMNLLSIWAVRIPLALWLVVGMGMGLNGVWWAMCIELCFRGLIFLGRMVHKFYIKKGK